MGPFYLFMLAVAVPLVLRLAIGVLAVPASETAAVRPSTHVDDKTKDSTRGLRDSNGKHLFEDDALQIVGSIRDEYLPGLDENSGGEILRALLLFADRVWGEATR